MAYSDVFQNHLYDRNFFENEILQTSPGLADPDAIFAALERLQSRVIAGDAKANLDVTFTTAILEILGWPHAYQQKFRFHGNRKIPDFFLFRDSSERDSFIAAPKDAKPLASIFSVWEDKAENVALDNGRTDTGNPYFQLMEYLTFLRLPFGFLSNGHEIWFVDNSEIFAEKRYLGVNLDRLLESRDVSALRIFMGIFGRSGHIAAGGREAPAAAISRESRKRRDQSEEELRNAIYGLDGRESMFEKCGALLYKNQPVKDQSILTELYKNCLYFTFRLIFIALFEDRHKALLEKHPGYQAISLAALYRRLKEAVAEGRGEGYDGWNALQGLFRTLDEGNPNLDIPLFNGGLFARQIAALRDRPKMMTNADLLELLDQLYGESETGFVRDFSSLSVIQLGRIYESLLEYEFRLAEENLWYFEYRQKRDGRLETIDGYYDTEDYTNIKNDRQCRLIGKATQYRKGEVYLVGGRNSRKQSASYYTPQSLSRPLVRAALDDAIAKLGKGESLLDIRILDNACGSGHLLVESLQYLTQAAIARLEQDPKLRSVLEEEKERIRAALSEMGLAAYGIDVDELALLKRILLKRTIYGVDLQPFAVELARLSLWIETFVFGTPLSFIEHHIKAGNSLLGCPLARIQKKLGSGQGSLLDQSITRSFRNLQNVFAKLSRLQDTTAADISESKKIYQSEIRSELLEMNSYFDLLNAADMLAAESGAERKLASEATPAGDASDEGWQKELLASAETKLKTANSFLAGYEKVAQDMRDQRGEWQATGKLLREMRERYGFFNWELEIP